MWMKLLCFGFILISESVLGDSSTDYNDLNPDGTFSFRHSNDDIGSFYHSASKSPDQIVRGRYGSRNPANRRIEETVYTAGPRGFRARGPQIHRKMDLSQYPVGPKGSPDDPLADPYDDPSYSFNFKTPEHERTENADGSGRVKGLYSFLDDIGERHTVRYAAGAGTGYEVINAVPDSPASVAYSAPLYKAPLWTRGKMSVRRGPNGQYDFIAAAPDHRRSETSGPDGIVRGSYSYLDDKGVQRTVQYIAGAGIGYRIVQNTVGPGTHLNPRPALPEYGIRDFQTNELDESGYARPAGPGSARPTGGGVSGSVGGGGGGGGLTRPGRPARPDNRRDQTIISDRKDNDFSGSGGEDNTNDFTSRDRGSQSGEGTSGVGGSSRYPNRATKRPGSISRSDDDDTNTGRGGYKYQGDKNAGSNSGNSNTNINEERYDDRGGNRDDGYIYDKGTSSSRNRPNEKDNGYQYEAPSGPRGGTAGGGGQNSGSRGSGSSFNKKPSTGSRGGGSFSASGSGSNIYDDEDYNRVPLVTSDNRQLNIDRNRDWSLRSRDSTVIKNVGKWYINLPPGQAVRAHVQNIDILPLGGRIQSPSEALRQDELNK